MFEWVILIKFDMKAELKLLVIRKPRQQSAKLINRSVLNKSSSKQLPFFTKAERFASSKKEDSPRPSRSQSSHSTTRVNKFPTIPQAERVLYFDQEKQLCLNPSPQAYHIKSKDDICKIKHRGGTMGVRFSSLTNVHETTPSAVDYQNQNSAPKKSFNRSFTFERSQRNLMKVLVKKGKDSPGPMYNVQSKPLINFHVKPPTKNHKKIKNNINKLKLSALQANRFSTIHLQNNQENPRISIHVKPITERGKSVKKNIGFSTTQRIRLQTLPQKSPGPGTYVFFSEFTGWM